MNNLQLFQKDDWKVRVVNQNDEPWFVAADVCKALDISRTDDGVSRLDEDEKGTDLIRTPGGIQKVTIVSEAGLYSLVLSSRKPEAKTFKRWVTHEVIPSIRKTGTYTSADRIRLQPEHELVRASLAISFEFLRPAESGKILLLRKAFKDAGLPTACLPDYCEEQVTQSATALLKKHNSSLSAIAFNQHMEKLGILKAISRPSSKGGFNQYWSITEKGLKYGKNLINEKRPKETQPHWYEESFPQLIEMVTGALV